MKTVEELDVFKVSHQMALGVYKITMKFPEEEKFGLVTQMRRAACSVPMNLVEGANRLSKKEYRNFVGIAKGSAGEVNYQLLLAKDLSYIDVPTYEEMHSKLHRMGQMLSGLSKALD